MQVRTVFFASIVTMCAGLNGVDLSEYISGNYMDDKGQTFLHQFCKNYGDRNFEISFKPFAFIDDKLPAEIKKLEEPFSYLEALSQISPDLAMNIILLKVIAYVQQKDNDGKTAFDIMNHSNDERHTALVDVLSNLNGEVVSQDIATE